MHHLGTRVAAPLLTAGLVLGLSAVAAPTASAKIIGRGVDTAAGSDEFTDCGGLNLRVDYEVRDVWVDKLRGGDLASFAYLTPWFTKVSGTTTQKVTNLDNGRWFVGKSSVLSWDQKVVSEEGTVGLYRRSGNRHFSVVRSDGSTFRRENGSFRYEYLYDTQGTSDTSDDTDQFVDGSFRQTGTSGSGDFCADVIALTT